MKASTTLAVLLGVATTNAVNMTPYKAGTGVEAEFAAFIEE